MRLLLAGLIAVLPAVCANAQDMSHMNMPGMDMSHAEPMAMTGLFGAYPMSRDASGTSWQPDAAPHEGLHASLDGWELMAHAMFDAVYDSQSGARGDTQWFVEGMAMGAARRDFGEGNMLNLRAMLSLDPFMGRRGYPLLLASGETADGRTPLVDRQHPHDLVMELSAAYSHAFGAQDAAFVYVGYPGEPAFGPPAFQHRASGMDIPEAPISHHWLDSTHITFGVVTAGFVHDDWKLEVSRLTGREPDQYRFDFDAARFDSTAARVTWNPSAHWSLEASWAYLVSPEQLEPSLNETRYAASAEYVQGPFAATLAWGHKEGSDAVLLEGEVRLDDWTGFLRMESVDGEGKIAPGVIHDWHVGAHTVFGLGALYDFDFAHGDDPHGAMLFARFAVR